MKKFTLLLFSLTLPFLIASCNKIDLTASYISVEPSAFHMDVSQYNNEHNTNYDASELVTIASQNFSDVWVYVDGTSLGTWELPCKIPILSSDSTRITLYPGVKMNGVSTTRPRYPFVDGVTKFLNLKGGEVLNIDDITFKYSSATKFEWIENFTRDYNSVFSASTEGGINFVHITDPDNFSNRIGMLALEDSVTEFEVISSNMTFGNKLPSSVFLEMDYRCDIEEAEVSVSMLIDKSTTSVTTTEPLVIVNAGPEWKKIYINLTQSIARNSVNAIKYRVQLAGGRDDNNPVHFYFDNMKVIYQ